MNGLVVLKSERKSIILFPNCLSCNRPLLKLASDGVSIVDRRSIGICESCERISRIVSARIDIKDSFDPYGQPIGAA